jgi:hypothetical protein
MARSIGAWGASRRPDAAASLLRSWAVRERPQGRPAFRLLAGLPLEKPWRGGPRRCAVCGLRSRRLRVLAYAARPWSDAYRHFARGALVHYSCATLPDEPLEAELPRSWLVRPWLPSIPPFLLDAGATPPERTTP